MDGSVECRFPIGQSGLGIGLIGIVALRSSISLRRFSSSLWRAISSKGSLNSRAIGSALGHHLPLCGIINAGLSAHDY